MSTPGILAIGGKMSANTFGISKSHGGASVEEKARRFAERLGARSGLQFVLSVERDYDVLLESACTGRVTVAWLPPLLYARAAVRGLTLAAVPERGGTLSYRSAILVARGAPFRSAADLRDVRAAWVDPSSSSGYIFPSQHLLRAGATFRDEAFHGSPNNAAAEVVAGRADLSTCPVSAEDPAKVQRAVDELLGPAAAALRVLTTTDPIPPDGLAVSPACPADVQQRLTEALLRFHEDAAGLSALQDLFRAGRLVSATEATRRFLRRTT